MTAPNAANRARAASARRRDDEAATLYLSGDSARVVGEDLGVSAEQVYRRLRRRGVPRRVRGNPSKWPALLAAVRRRDTFTLSAAATRAGVHLETAVRLARQHDRSDAFARLFAWRRRADRQRARIVELRAVALELGRTPRIRDMSAATVRGIARPYTAYVAAFGTWGAALRAAFPDHR